MKPQTFDAYLPDWVPAGFSLLNMPGRELAGNLVFVTGEGDERKVLKLYRQRRGNSVRRFWTKLSNYAFEGKRGESAEDRRETERLCLELWAREGFDTFKILGKMPAPEWLRGQPHLWLEFVPGRRLFDELSDAEVSRERKEALVRRLAAVDRRRHVRAVELQETLLIQEHATVKHTWLSREDDRLITMDLENAFQPSYPVMDALGQELTGVLRSLWVSEETSECFAEGSYPRLYVEAYGDDELLRKAMRVRLGNSVRTLIKRYGDRRRRSRPKTVVAEQLLALLGDA